jgi:hypothetical protein
MYRTWDLEELSGTIETAKNRYDIRNLEYRETPKVTLLANGSKIFKDENITVS